MPSILCCMQFIKSHGLHSMHGILRCGILSLNFEYYCYVSYIFYSFNWVLYSELPRRIP